MGLGMQSRHTHMVVYIYSDLVQQGWVTLQVIVFFPPSFLWLIIIISVEMKSPEAMTLLSFVPPPVNTSAPLSSSDWPWL